MFFLTIQTSRPILGLNPITAGTSSSIFQICSHREPASSKYPSFNYCIIFFLSLTITVFQSLYMWQGLCLLPPLPLCSEFFAAGPHLRSGHKAPSHGLDAAESRALIPLHLSHSSSINTAQSVLWNLQNRFYILPSKLDGRYKYDITYDQYEIFLAHYVLVVNVTLGFLEASSIHVSQTSWDGAIRGVLGQHTFQLSLILKEPYLFFVCSSCRDVKLVAGIHYLVFFLEICPFLAYLSALYITEHINV